MSEEQEPQKLDRTPATPKDLDLIAKTLDEFRRVYADAAQAMRDEGHPVIFVKGMSNLRFMLERINGVRGSLQKAIVEARTAFIDKPKSSAQAYLDEHVSELPEPAKKVAETRPNYEKPKARRTGKKSS